ncbi:MAG: galactokinase [Acidimicrobiales bacterium]
MNSAKPSAAAYAPGRVNLIGEHTDYNSGTAVPMTISMGTEVRYEAGGDQLVVESDLERSAAVVISPCVEIESLVPWVRLCAALVRIAAPGLTGRIAVTSSLPSGAGLASSAALGVAMCLAVGVKPEPITLAQVCQKAEEAVGVPSGLMDPLVVAASLPDHALLIDFAELSTRAIELPEDLEIVVVDSGERRTLSSSVYAERRAECEAAASRLGVPLGLAPQDAPGAIGDPVLRGRARHVVSEVRRVGTFVDALGAGDYETAGGALIESHRSLRDDFGVSTPALDALVEEACSMEAVYGARLTGAGLGGCIIALCRPGAKLDLGTQLWRVRPGGAAHKLAPLA